MIPVYRGDFSFQQLKELAKQRMVADPELEARVKAIIEQVRTGGDAALRELAERFGDTVPERFMLSETEIQEAINRVSPDTCGLLARAAENIRAFAQAVIETAQPVSLHHGTFQVGMRWKPVQRVACYVPGGRYPLPSTALMTAVTAQVAGVPEIILFSPSFRDEVVVAGTLAGVRSFCRLGGAQAVAAAAFGTESIRSVDMLVGPGNAYVTEAKRQLQGVIGIDMLAGPSEVAIIADEGADPKWVALDLLAQAEHDPDARAYLFTDSDALAQNVLEALEDLVQSGRFPDYIRTSRDWGAIFHFPSLADCVAAANTVAPEHLELLVADPDALKSDLLHYGALFLGYDTPVPYGDYMAGPNHTLPTGRTARFGGGLNPFTFLRPQTWIAAGPHASALSEDTARFARLEGLIAHELSARARQKTEGPGPLTDSPSFLV